MTLKDLLKLKKLAGEMMTMSVDKSYASVGEDGGPDPFYDKLSDYFGHVENVARKELQKQGVPEGTEPD